MRCAVKDNSRLGGFQLGPLPPAPRGVPQIDVAFNIDSNGILFVTATDLGTKKKESITISNSKGRLSEQEIEKMIRDAKKFADSDRKAKARLEAKQELENLMRSIHSSLGEEIGKNLDAHEKEEMEEQLSETRKWIDSKKGKSADKEDFADRKKELERIWNPLVSKAYRGGGGEDDQSQGEGDEAQGDSGPDEL